MGKIISDKCRNILIEISNENKEVSIYPMWDGISEILQSNQYMNEFFEEIESKLGKHPIAIRAVLERILDVSSRFNIDEMKSKNNAQREIQKINEELLVNLKKLSNLLKRKEILCGKNGLFDASENNILSLILDASKNNPRFQLLMKPEIERLRYQYNIDYLPSLFDIFEQLKESIQDSNVQFADNIIEEALSGHKPVNRTNFVKTIYNVIDENKKKNYGFIPDDFYISGKNMATLVNCVLNLEGDEIVDSEFIKNIKQSMKK